MTVCILGNGLTALTLAKALVNYKIDVDVLSNKKNYKTNTLRTIGITKNNFDFFNKNITIELNDFDSHISFVINDNGEGFKNLNNNIKEILNPYFTTKKEGTGLGLSIVNKIINDHNGSIEFISEEDGATIKIVFIK